MQALRMQKFEDMVQKSAMQKASSNILGSLDLCITSAQEEQLLAATKEYNKQQVPRLPKFSNYLGFSKRRRKARKRGPSTRSAKASPLPNN